MQAMSVRKAVRLKAEQTTQRQLGLAMTRASHTAWWTARQLGETRREIRQLEEQIRREKGHVQAV